MSSSQSSVGSLGLGVEQSFQLNAGSVLIGHIFISEVQLGNDVSLQKIPGTLRAQKNSLTQTFLGKYLWMPGHPRQGAQVVDLSIPDGGTRENIFVKEPAD